MAYEPPSGYKVGLAFLNGYEIPAGYKVAIEFNQSSGPVGDTQYIFPVDIDGLEFGSLSLRHQYRYVAPTGIQETPIPTTHNAYLYVRYVSPPSINQSAVGRPSIRNWNYQAYPPGFIATAYGRPLVWNLRQYIVGNGYNASLYGSAYVQGGVKSLEPKGFDSLAIGRPLLINTTADQTAKPQGIPAPAMSAPSVSPRSIRAIGYGTQLFGSAFVQRSPMPLGWQSSAFGYPTIEDKTKYVATGGTDWSQYGYPRVFDPTQKVLASSVVRSAVFGDTAIKNVRLVVKLQGFETVAVSQWADVRNTRRFLLEAGFNSALFGESTVANKSPNITPVGFDSLSAPSGLHTGIGYSVRIVEGRGSDLLKLGTPSLSITPSLSPKGFAGAAGTPTIWFRVRNIGALGANNQLFGNSNVWFRYRSYQAQGFYSQLFGNPKIEHEHRGIEALGAHHAAYGVPIIQLRTRTIAPSSVWVNFATAHMVGGLRYLRPVGFDASAFGKRIIPEVHAVYPQGLAGSYGLAEVGNKTTLVKPLSITTGQQPADRWGRATAFNLRQYIHSVDATGSELAPPSWSLWTLIENRNKYIGVTGNAMTRHGRQVVANNATPIIPAGIEAPSMPIAYKAGLVAFRIRPLRLDGIEQPHFTSWLTVYNDAAVVGAKGFNAERFGLHQAENTRRTFKIQGYDYSLFGWPMVAFGRRHITFEDRYTIAPPVIAMPEAKLYTRYIEIQGYEPWGVGSPSLAIHFTIIAPRWLHANYFGEPRVKNVTPELTTKGRDSQEFGATAIRLQWRRITTLETFTQIIPRPIIADRDRLIDLRGIQALTVSDKLKVIKTGAPPYSEQRISLTGTVDDSTGAQGSDGHGIRPPGSAEYPQVSKPVLNQQVVYHYSEEEMSLYGIARITSNVIRVPVGYNNLEAVAKPRVELLIREINVPNGTGPNLQTQVSKPSLSPHTIYSTIESPQQARLNHPHPSIRLHVVDGLRTDDGCEAWGRTTVQNRHRAIRPVGMPWIHSLSAYPAPRPTIINKRTMVTLNGINSMRIGRVMFSGDRWIDFYQPFYATLFGATKVQRGPPRGPQTIKVTGHAHTQFGQSRVELLHRTVTAQGFVSERMGTKKNNDKPYMWQGLRVGEYVPFTADGFVASVYGNTTVSFRVRGLTSIGFDSFLSEYDIENFGLRMIVRRRDLPVEQDTITAQGFDSSGLGTPDARPLVHYIRPDGNSDQYRKGAF